MCIGEEVRQRIWIGTPIADDLFIVPIIGHSIKTSSTCNAGLIIGIALDCGVAQHGLAKDSGHNNVLPISSVVGVHCKYG